MTDDGANRFNSLKDKFGRKLILNIDDFPDYARDASEITLNPDAIFFAESESDVIEVINYCRNRNIPIVFRGAGTGYTGGSVPSPGSLALSLEKINSLAISAENKTALCGPGVITIDLMKAAESHGLFYPPDPASFEESTLGGNVAECAGGLHCKKYGVTKDYVIGLKMVTVEGNILKTGIFNSGGLFDLTGVIIGSEGLLGAVTEIAVRLIDGSPAGPTILAAFNKPEDAALTVAEIIRRGIIPAVMEYMDGDAIACSNAYEKADTIENAEAILLFETSGTRALKESDDIETICRRNKSSTLIKEIDKSRSEKLWELRRNLSKAVKAAAGQKISEDVCVPPSRLPELVAFVTQLNNEYSIRINSFGHAGDGNLHVNFLTESERKEDYAIILESVERLFLKTLELGGTLTGEHGIGLTKKDYLHLEFNPPTLSFMKNVKMVFDPNFVFNPGKMFK